MDWYGARVTDTPTDANTVDALLLSVEGWIVDGEVDRAREALRSLRSRGVEDPEIDYLDGVACWREGEDEAAQVHFEAAIQLDPEHSDAHHGLFMLFEALDAHEDSVRCGLEVLRLDALHDRVDSAEFESRAQSIRAIASAVLARLPEQFAVRLDTVPVVLEARPSTDLVAQGFDPRALGLFEGPEDSARHDPGPIPSRIVLFTHNLIAEFPEMDELESQVEITLLHEIGHYFGLDEDGVAALGLA